MERIYFLGMLANINSACQFLAAISAVGIAALVALTATDGKQWIIKRWIKRLSIAFIIAIIGSVTTPNHSTVSAMIHSQQQTKE